MAGEKKITTSKREISERKILLTELPYYNYTGSLIMHYGQFNDLSNGQTPANKI